MKRPSDFRLRTSGFPGWVIVAVGATLLTGVPSAKGQPHIGYIYPAGGQRGTSFEAVVGGQSLSGVTNVVVSGDGVQANVIEYNRPLGQAQFNDLRDEFRALQQKRRAFMDGANRSNQVASVAATNAATAVATNVWTADDEARMEEIRARILKNPPNRQGNPAIAETVTIRVSIATNSNLTECEFRLRTPAGISNPLQFRISDLPETTKPAARAVGADLSFLRQLAPGRAPVRETDNPEIRVHLPAVVNGQIMPGAIDRIRFQARAGQQLVAIASARQLIPYLADAVPGWFQATLALFDADGRELAYEDDYHFHPDPVLRCVIPKDGDYVLEIKDAIFRGRQDFVYRIDLGELPFVTGTFPLGGRVGEETAISLNGWNLATTNLSFRPDEASAGICPVTLRAGEQRAQTMLFGVDSLPECLEQEPNDLSGKAQKVSLPIIVNGRIDQPGDVDLFRIEGRAGDQVVAEVLARRLGSPLDSALRLTDSAGRRIASNDDCENKADGLNTHHADSYLRVNLPKNGIYYLHLGDAARHGSAEHAYRLRISPPRPDFELRVSPSSVVLRGGVSTPLTIQALRKDGFEEDIRLALVKAPPGFTLDGGVVPGRAEEVRVTITAPAGPPQATVALVLEGRAMIDGREVIRPGVAAEDMMQAFAYRHLVPAQELLATLAGRVASAKIAMAETAPVRIPVGGTAGVVLKMPGGFAERNRFELNEAPAGIQLERVVSNRFGAELVLQCATNSLKPGTRGNLIVNILPGGSGPAANPAAANRRRTPIGALPAIPFEIAPAPAAAP